MLIFDNETNGLLDNLTEIKCINMLDTETGKRYRYTDYEFYLHEETGEPTDVRTPRTGTIRDGMKRLAEAPAVAGHNIVGFDIPAIQKVYPEFRLRGDAIIRDTKLMGMLLYPALKDMDFANMRKGKLPHNFRAGSHKLADWAIRFGGPLKTDFNPKDWGWTWNDYPFSKTCDDYCMDDVIANADIYKKMASREYPTQPLDLEMKVAEITGRQERHGFLFDVAGCENLVRDLQVRKLELEEQLRETFGSWCVPDGKPFTPKRGNKKKGVVAGCTYQKIKWVEFNPGSRSHIANRMTTLFGWVPKEFTPKGQPKVDETVLEALPYPEAKLCVEYLTVDKRLGQMAEGNQAWLKKVGPDGRIHGRVNTLGTVTGRMSHSDPNVAQVPKVGSYLGAECRSLFTVPPGKKLVGCDADGLELRCLAHYMDDPAYTEAVVNGKKADGTDAHSVNQKALGFQSRDQAKTWIYAYLYGAGAHKLGTIVVADFDDEKRARFYAKFPEGKKRDAAYVRLGNRSKDRIAEGLPALGRLQDRVQKAAKRGYLKGIDGRRTLVRSKHAALNTLLQGCGAIVMKKAQVILDVELQAQGLQPGVDYEFCATVHDEWQLEVSIGNEETVGGVASDAIVRAGEAFDMRCPLAGSYDIGPNWSATH